MTTVAITQNLDIDQAVTEALQTLDVEPRVRDKQVAIKPNDTWASPEDLTAVTQADTLRAVLRYLKRFKPRQMIVTGGAGAAETEDVFRLSGMMDVIEEEGAEFFDHNRPPFTEVALEYRPDFDVMGPQESVMVNSRVIEFESLIVLSQLKVHETATVTLALKNIAMSFPAADYYGHPRGKEKAPHHFFEDMSSFIAAMGHRFRADLAITVGHPAMVGIGPIGGVTVETGMVIASTDMLAADVAAAQLLGFTVRGVHHLWEAQRLGVGEGDLEKMQFPCLDINEAFARFTKAVYGRALELDHP